VKTLNQTSLHMRQMGKVEAELSASVGGFRVDFCSQCPSFPDESETETNPVSETLCSLAFRWIKSKNPVTLSDIQYVQANLSDILVLITYS
jgi:hypothetical protein